MANEILKEFKVLFVEDEQNIAKLLKSAIGDNFYSFSIAKNGKEGIEKFLKSSPDIVITDIMMPDMTGLEMAQKLKELNPKLPIIVLSAHSEKEKLLNAIDVGVIKYFIKPFDPDDLLEYIISISHTLGRKLISLVDGFQYNKTSKRLYKDGRYVHLTKRESILLSLLLKNRDYIVDNEKLKANLWTEEEATGERLRTFIKRFREKTSKKIILNVKGRGYQLQLSAKSL